MTHLCPTFGLVLSRNTSYKIKPQKCMMTVACRSANICSYLPNIANIGPGLAGKVGPCHGQVIANYKAN